MECVGGENREEIMRNTRNQSPLAKLKSKLRQSDKIMSFFHFMLSMRQYKIKILEKKI